MKILGHNFLRSNFVAGDPVRKTAAARQQNRVANFIKGLQGLGCRVQKDIESNLENCLIVVDGTSDVEYPSNWVSPWPAAEEVARASVALGPDYTDGGTTIPFSTLDHHTNDDILLPNDAGDDGTWESISVLKSGIYTVAISASWMVSAGAGIAGPTASARSSDDTNLVSCGFQQDDIESTSGGTGVFHGSGGQSGNFYLPSGETIDVDVTGAMSGIRL